METPYRHKPPEAYIAEIEDLKQEIVKLQKPTLWKRFKAWLSGWYLDWYVGLRKPERADRGIAQQLKQYKTKQIVIGNNNIQAQGDVFYTLDDVSDTMEGLRIRLQENEERRQQKLKAQEENMRKKMEELTTRLREQQQERDERLRRRMRRMEDRLSRRWK